MQHKIRPGEIEWTAGKVDGFYAKELVTLNHGSAKLIKIDPFATYPLHLHPDKTEYAYVIDGQAEFEIGDQQFNSVQGDFFVFPINTKHAIRNRQNEECHVLLGTIKG